ncbi:hypothetical protein M7I_5291 [Glarea lozoyensis 74030]|uniref:Uncharacterized protein n=1 Tax=Glarea lozoyensis (strain ATCC 74030 / MF5533) TaxID=1104152 RepID=H0ERH2_GLAL7|nr:hypothetical protein M7I_5291 [Glarea lozoyensis 74030]
MSSPNPKVDVQERHKISVRTLPSENPTIFKESTFFTRNGPGTSLPSPIEKASVCGFYDV